MTHILKNKNLEIHVDFPLENYKFSRFDWTGKIVVVKFKNIPFSSAECIGSENEHDFGKGFYNEFGIETPLGFDEAEVGGWFHKIGIGLLKKEGTTYDFGEKYKIKPAAFELKTEPNKLTIECISDKINGYSYLLRKEIQLYENSFTITYHLQNTGDKDIITDEYVHNFTAINNAPIGTDYVLKFPFELKPTHFDETVNPEQKVSVGLNEINFKGTPQQAFFFSNLSGGNTIDAAWELINNESKLALKETGSFKTKKINLWGMQHVISPELFFNISLKPSESTEWTRNYKVSKID